MRFQRLDGFTVRGQKLSSSKMRRQTEVNTAIYLISLHCRQLSSGRGASTPDKRAFVLKIVFYQDWKLADDDWRHHLSFVQLIWSIDQSFDPIFYFFEWLLFYIHFLSLDHRVTLTAHVLGMKIENHTCKLHLPWVESSSSVFHGENEKMMQRENELHDLLER